jgi:hypothetical protein
MQLCANENVPGDCVARLRQRGHDVLWSRETAPGARETQRSLLLLNLRRVCSLPLTEISGSLFTGLGRKPPVAWCCFVCPSPRLNSSLNA